MMFCITPTKRFDMWFRERSVNTTEYSSRPSGSISGRGRVTAADCHTGWRRRSRPRTRRESRPWSENAHPRPRTGPRNPTVVGKCTPPAAYEAPKPTVVGKRAQRGAGRRPRSHVEPELHHVTVGHHVVLALQPHLAARLGHLHRAG